MYNCKLRIALRFRIKCRIVRYGHVGSWGTLVTGYGYPFLFYASFPAVYNIVMKLPVVIKFIVCLALTFSAAFLGSLFTRNDISDWYASINKPFFTPPDWLFGPVWTVLYLLMSLSAFLVWQKGLDSPIVRIALAFYLLQLILNGLWTPLFFGLKMPLVAFIEILLLWTAIVFTIIASARVSMPAALLLLPYIIWTSFAAVLNFSIWLLNR